MSLSISRAATLGGSNPRRVEWIDKIHVHCDVKSGRVERCNLQGFVNDVGHPSFIQFTHREDANAERFQKLAFSGVYAASPDDRGVLRQNLWRESGNVRELARAAAQQRKIG